MSNGEPRNLTRATELEKTLSATLIAVAAAITAGLFALWPGLLTGLSHAGAQAASIVIIFIIISLALSMFFGGRGYAYGPKKAGFTDRFNLQAVLGTVGIFLIVVVEIITFATTEPSPNEKFAAKLTELESKVADLAGKVDGNFHELPNIKSKLDDITNRLDAATKALDGLTRASADQSNKLNEGLTDIKSLSTRLDQIEKSATPSKP